VSVEETVVIICQNIPSEQRRKKKKKFKKGRNVLRDESEHY
jgi:hypothetical protein